MIPILSELKNPDAEESNVEFRDLSVELMISFRT